VRGGSAAAVVAMLAALAGPAVAAPADLLPPLAERFCAAVAAPTEAVLAADPDDLRRTDPDGALAQACARWRLPAAEGASRWTPWLDLGQALMAQSRADDARELLRAIEAAAADDIQARAEVQLSLGSIAADEGLHAESGRYFDAALALLQAAGGPPTRLAVMARVGRANALRNVREPGNLDRADAALEEASALLTQLGLARSRMMADVLNARTVLAHARQDLEGAARYAYAEVALYRERGEADSPDLIDAYASLGAILSQLGRFDEAKAALDTGAALGRRYPDVSPAAQLGILNALAAMHLDRGQYADALIVAERALAYASKNFGEGGARTLTPLNSRATALYHLARLAQAQQGYEQALAVSRAKVGEVGALRQLRLLDNLTGLYLQLNDVPAAQRTIADGMAIVGDDKQLGYWRGRLLRFRAAIAAQQQRWADADALHAEAAPLIAQAVGDAHPYVQISTAARCVAQVRGALGGTACADLQSRIASFDGAGTGLRYQALAALAEAAEASVGRDKTASDDARSLHLQALAVAEAIGAAYPLWAAYDVWARHLRAAGEPVLAVAFGKQAVAQIEAVRAGFSGPAKSSDVGFVADKHAVYRRLADWLTEDGRVAEALEVLRLLKADEFADFVRRDARLAIGEAGSSLPLSPTEERWRDEWRPPPAAPGSSTPIDERSLVQRWRDWLAQAAGSAAPRPQAAAAAPAPAPPVAVDSRELRAWLYPGEAAMNLVIDAPGASAGASAGAAAQRDVIRLPVPPAALARDVGQVLAAIGRRENVLDRLQTLYRQIAAPIAAAAARSGARRIVLQLDGALRYLPFAALHDGSRYLGERYAIEQRAASSAGAGTGAGAGAPVPALRTGLLNGLHVQALGVTRAMGGMAALPAVADEVCGIVAGPVEGLMPGDGACAARRRGDGVMAGAAWMNDAFTAERLSGLPNDGLPAGGARMLHVGTHFMLRPGHVGKSWLLMGDGRRLTLDELAAIEAPAHLLVTLSACESGLGGAADPAGGGEIDGLATLMMRRGAQSVVASLWRVEDRSTSLLMRALYAAMKRGLDPASALQQAQGLVRRSGGERGHPYRHPYDHPYYWAGFYLSSR
jgi:CHAT domain-containing protein/tetratricopeptide (TPR) repeat protein